MADAIQISGQIQYDGDYPLAGDPFSVALTVKDTDGAALKGADVMVALLQDGSALVKQTATTDARGAASVSLEAPQGTYKVQVEVSTSTQLGYTTIGGVYVGKSAPFTTVRFVPEPVDLTANVVDGNADLSWSPAAKSNKEEVYQEKDTTLSLPGATIIQTFKGDPPSSRSLTVTGLEGGQDYSFAVQSTAPDGDTALSNVVTVTIANYYVSS